MRSSARRAPSFGPLTIFADKPILLRMLLGTGRAGGGSGREGARRTRAICLAAAACELPACVLGRHPADGTFSSSKSALRAGKARPVHVGDAYSLATKGQTLEGAHDALADAEALALVWRWLVTDAGADAQYTRRTHIRGRLPGPSSISWLPHGQRQQQQDGAKVDGDATARLLRSGVEWCGGG